MNDIIIFSYLFIVTIFLALLVANNLYLSNMLKSQTAHSLLLERKVNQLSFIVNALNERITNIYDTCSDNDDSEYDNIMEIQKSSQEIRDGIDKVLIKQEQFISNYVNSYVP